MNDRYRLTPREADVLTALWMAEQPMVASAIRDMFDPPLNINTVQVGLQGLMDRGLVAVDGVVHSGRVLSRTYKTLLTPTEFVLQEYGTCLSADFYKGMIDQIMKNNKFPAEELHKLRDAIRKQQEAQKNAEE